MGSKTTSTQENKPPEWATPLFKQSAGIASNLYNSGVGGNPFMGSTVSPLSGTTMSGVNQLAQAGQNWNTAGTRPLWGGLGAASVSDPFISQIAGLAGGVQGGKTDTSGIYGGKTDTSGISAGQVGTGDYRGILDRAQAPTSASTNLQGYASGEYLKGDGNPFYRQRLEGDLADTAAQVRSLMSGSGRLGSDVSNDVLADRLGRLRTAGLEEDFNRQTQNQFNANAMIDAANQGALGQQLGAASGIAGIGAGNADRSLQAGLGRAGFSAGDLDRGLQAGISRAGFDAGDLNRALEATGLQGNLLSSAAGLRGQGLDRAMSATGAMAGLDQQNFQNQLTGAGATLQAGGMMDKQAQAQLSDAVKQFYEQDNAEWQRLGLLQAAASGAAGPYGTQTGTSRTSNPAAVLGGLGGLFGGK